MGDYAEVKRMNSQLNHLSEEPQLGFSSPISRLNAGETLIDKFKNVDLNLDRKAVLDDTEPFAGGTHMLPLRPDAGDCPHYMRTGTCRFGVTCRFNHPIILKTDQAVKDMYSSSGKAGKTECKYYLRAGGCKYGIFCKFSHSNYQTDTELNVIGLPIRLGEKECPHYMRYGSCGYGAECVFHHPEPTLMEGLDTLDPSFDDESMIKSGYSFRNSNSESPALLSGASQPIQGHWSTHPSSRKTSVYQNENSSYVNINSLPQGTEKRSEWKAHQAPYVIYEEKRADIMPEQNLTSTQVEELAERPGQPICTYLLKTGNCKFNSACHFHHPKNWVPKSDRCVLSDKGLPLRPGREVCQHYRRFGICKFGSACMLDHPTDLTFVPVKNQPHAQTASGEDSNL